LISLIKALLILISGSIISGLGIPFLPINSGGKVSYIVSKTFSKTVLFIAGVRLKVEGREKINKKEKYIFISNHLSYFDIPVLISAIPNNLRFIYKKSIAYVPFFGWAVYLGGYVPVDRKNARSGFEAIRKAAWIIKNRGLSFIVFPEGTRSRNGNLGEFKRGAFLLANEAKEKIVPVTIVGSDKILPKKSFKIKSGKIKVIFGEPVEYREDKLFLNEIREIISKNIENARN
jgi:1-acyl-sn-glycerol-3-phosphate acyltransferase